MKVYVGMAVLWYLYAVVWSLQRYVIDNPDKPVTKEVVIKAFKFKLIFL